MRKMAKRIGALVLASVLAVTMLPQTELKSYAADKEVTGYTASELTTMFSRGFNIGNTMDATGGTKNNIYSYERSWGNPEINKELIHGIKEAGFTFVRIPITWQKHIAKDGKNTIDAEWLERVKTVIDYCYEEDLFVIINVHHDDSWLNIAKFSDEYKNIGVKLGDVWAQVADYFADYDQRLIFESMNEPRAKGTDYEWTGNQACYDAINYLNQIFVDTVRGNGKGHNSERALMIPGYAASNSRAVLESIKIPDWKGAQAENIIIAVHCYSPYNFCLSDNQIEFDPNSEADTSDVKRMFRDFETYFLSKGIPVVLGECGATRQGDNVEEREEYLYWFSGMCRQYGVPACIWDNGVNGKSGGENHSYISRRNGSVVYPTLVRAFIYEKPLESLYIDFEPVVIDGKTSVKPPSDCGFFPSGIMGKMKINHTADVKLGYSANVGSGVKDSTAYLDISAYKTRMVKITAFLYSEDDVVSVGLAYGDEKKEYANVTVKDNVWKGVGFAVELPAAEDLTVYFKGEDGKTFYIDDVAVELVDSLEGITFDFGDETTSTDTTTSETSVSASTSSSASTSDLTETTTTESASEGLPNAVSNSFSTIIWVIGGVLVAAIIVMVLSVVLGKKKK